MKARNKIVFVNQSAGFLDVDVINAYCQSYQYVHLIYGKIFPGTRELDHRVKVTHICKYNRSSSVKRLFTWLWGSLQIFCILLMRYRGWLVVYYTNPPLACFSSLLLPNKFRIVEYDVYPDALKTIGVKESSAVYKLWAALKCRLYKKVEKVYTLSEGMKEVLTQYGTADKINVVPLWSMSDNFSPIDKSINPFIKENHLEGKFIVLYSGNIGYTHSVEILIEVAKRMKDDDGVQFLIIGEGKKKAELQKIVCDYKLRNVSFYPYQEFDKLPYSLASADIGVITLDENVSKVSVPSKTFNLMAVGAPLLAIANKETEMYRLINKYQNGRCIPKTDISEIVDYILTLKNDKQYHNHLSNNSLLASKDFTYKNADYFLD